MRSFITNVLDKIVLSNSSILFDSDVFEDIKSIYECAWQICREFGRRTNETYSYVNKIIEIVHDDNRASQFGGYGENKDLRIVFKGEWVFDCTILKGNNVRIKRYSKGEWEEYLKKLQNRVDTYKAASEILQRTYSMLAMTPSTVVRNPEARITWKYDSRNLNINLYQDQNKGIDIQFAAEIRYKGKLVFKAKKFYPNNYNRATSRTKYEVFKHGEWERLIREKNKG